MKTKLVMVALVGTALFSCAPKVITPASPSLAPANVMTPALVEGKNLYENNCGKCHNLYDSQEFTAEQWRPIVLRMQPKAKIQDSERELIYNYLTMK